MLFNNGENPKSLPQIELDGQLLNYKQNTKFLGVYITTKLNWRLHIENLINKARKCLNFLNIVSTQSWSQDTNTSKLYIEAGMISLSEQRKMAISKYVIRSLTVINSVTEEFFYRFK